MKTAKHTFKEVGFDELDSVIETRMPIGRFFRHTTKNPVVFVKDNGAHDFLEDEDVYIAVDNSSGDAWTEEFKTFEDCKAFLESDT